MALIGDVDGDFDDDQFQIGTDRYQHSITSVILSKFLQKHPYVDNSR